MNTDRSARDTGDPAILGTCIAIIAMAVVVLVGWHAHIRAAVQIFPGLIPMQYNTALCFLALGAAGIALSFGRRALLLAAASFAAIMGALVVLEYATGVSFGIDTLFFYPWERTLSADPGRMALTTGVGFLLAGGALLTLAVRRDAYAVFGIVNSVPLSLALTSLIGYAFQITYVLPFNLGSQMALLTSVAFLAYGIVMMAHAWRTRGRGADGLPTWTAGIGVALMPVLLVGASAMFPRQSWRSVSIEVLLAVIGVVLTALAARVLITARVAYKGLVMIAVPLILLLTFVGIIVRVKRQSEAAHGWARALGRRPGRVTVAAAVHRRSGKRGARVRHHRRRGLRRAGAAVHGDVPRRSRARLRSLVDDNAGQRARAETIQRLTAERARRFTEIIRLVKSGNQRPVQADIAGETGPGLMTRIRAELAVFSREEAQLDVDRRLAEDLAWQRLSWLLVAGTAGAILLASILTLSFSGGISRRLQRVRDNATALAGGRALAPLAARARRNRPARPRVSRDGRLARGGEPAREGRDPPRHHGADPDRRRSRAGARCRLGVGPAQVGVPREHEP